MSDYSWEVGAAANQAFSSPTNLTANRLGQRIVASDSSVSSQGKSVSSSRSRRSPSIISSQDEADLFDQMTQATSVKVRSNKNKKLTQAVASLSPTSGGHARQHNNGEDYLTSPNSNGSMYSADYDEGESYFQPGGSLSISSPGQVEEKAFDWAKRTTGHQHHPQYDNLDIPALEEKKSTDQDEQERKPAVTPRNAQAVASPSEHTEPQHKSSRGSADGTRSHADSIIATKKVTRNQLLVETVNGSEDSDEVMAFRRIQSDAVTIEEQSTEGQIQSSATEEAQEDVLDWVKSTESNRSSDFVITERNPSQSNDIPSEPTNLSDAQNQIVDQTSTNEPQPEAAVPFLPVTLENPASASEGDNSSNNQPPAQGDKEGNELPVAATKDAFAIAKPQIDQLAPSSNSKETGDGLAVASDHDADLAKADEGKMASFQFSSPSDEVTLGNPASATEENAFVPGQSAPGAVGTSPGESTAVAEDLGAQAKQAETTATVTPVNPFDTFSSMASQFQQSFHSSMHPEASTEKQSHVTSAVAPPSHNSWTDTAMAPVADSAHAGRIFPEVQNNMHASRYLEKGPRTQIMSHGTTDPLSETPDIMRLQVELREAIKLAESTDVPETKLLWRNRASELQRKLLEGHQHHELNQQLQRTQHRTGLESPLPQQNGFQYNDEYYAMYSEYAENGKAHVQSLEYESSRMVDVIAPADLPGGYHFEAEIEGQRFLATVPVGGVQQGETFSCYMRELNSVAIDIPVGYWKDNLCHMCKHGLCHPTLWHGLFCPLILLGQITHRLQLDFLGRPKYPGAEQTYTNRFMMLLVTGTWTTLNVLLLFAANYKWTRAVEFTGADLAAVVLVNLFMYAFSVFVVQSTRSSIREKFMIQEDRCYDLEDVVCASTCLPCTVAQMARHTANYDDYEAVCCSKTGLPDGVQVKHTVHMKDYEQP